ncbi:MAG: hypothetical protein LUQ59_02425 [Methanothrix sp.]|nr:hypothetical protein [Methanothrix sp.]
MSDRCHEFRYGYSYLDLHGLARNGLREIAVRGVKARGLRMDAVFYPAGRCCCSMKFLAEIRVISFEIGMRGRQGLDINDPKETHVQRAVPGRVFSALEQVCIMYAGFNRDEPGFAFLC